jgi:hypothetical protein
MPRGHPSHTTTTTASASKYVPPPTPSTSFNTKPPSSLSPFEESDDGPDMHKNLVKNFLKIGGYTGALYALIQGQCYQECMRCEDVLELCLTNMGAYYCSDPSAIGAVGEYLEVKATVVGVDPKSNKPEVICSIRGKDPLTCIFFLTGHYFFYRYLLHNDCTPTGLMPQQRRTGNENDGNLSGK